MNFLLDHNLPPNWADCLSALSSKQFDQGQVDQVVALRNKFPPNTPDIEWLTAIGKEGQWAIISGDGFRKKNGAERNIIRKLGLSVFVLQPSWSTKRYWEKTSQLILWWPKIVEQVNSVDNIAMEIPWRISNKFKQI